MKATSILINIIYTVLLYDKELTCDEAMNTISFFLLQQVDVIHGEISRFVDT